MSWQRQYRTASPMVMAYFFTGVLAFIGLINLILIPWVGVLALVLAVAVPIAATFLGKRTTIICSDQGFAVRTESRRQGTTEAAYGWHEVTATNYYETVHRRPRGGTQRAMHFEVETVRGRAITVSNGISNLADLIEVFNTMAPQVAYVWKKQVGFTVSLGPAVVSRGAYVSVPREQAGTLPQ